MNVCEEDQTTSGIINNGKFYRTYEFRELVFLYLLEISIKSQKVFPHKRMVW